MARKVAKATWNNGEPFWLNRRIDSLYYVDRRGNVYEARMKRGGTKGRKVCRCAKGKGKRK